MDAAVHVLASRVPPPALVPFSGSYVFRHLEELPEQAVVQKLSRVVSGLRAAQLLCASGLFQEQATIQRMVDEIAEDVFFLCVPLINKQPTDLHRRYLEIFYQEEYDSSTGKPLDDAKAMVQRKSIRAYIAQHGGDDPSGHIKAGKAVHRADSGYVHAASPHIMDSYGGSPPHFHTAGMLGTPREVEYRWYIKNYFFRSSMSFALAANAFGLGELHAEMLSYSREWEQDLEGHRW